VPPLAAVPKGRKKTARGKSAPAVTALDLESQNPLSPGGAKETKELPPGWQWNTIPDLVSDDGLFIDGDWVESKDQDPNGDVRLIQLADVGDGVYRDKSDRFMTRAKADALRCTFLKEGDVLIARMPEPFGRACIFPGDAKPSVTVVDVAIVRSGKAEFDHRWLASFVNAHPFRSLVSGLQAGSTRKRISRRNLATIPLPVPPLPDQRRIVAEIEKQFTRMEAGVAALRRVQANLKRYRAAVLKAACEGRLVPTEAELTRSRSQQSTNNSQPSFETGEQLLARILTDRRKNRQGRGKYKEPAAPNTAGLPPLPQGWTWAAIEQLGDVQLGRQRSPKNVSKNYPTKYIRAANITERGIDLSDVLEMEFSPAARERFTLRDGDVVLSEASGSPSQVGKPAVWRQELPLCCFQNTVLRLSSGGRGAKVCALGFPALLR
jgi:type I restriction enzyme S subunit